MHLGYDLIEERASQFGKTISGLISAPVTGCNTNFIYKSDRHDCNLFLFYAKGYNYSPLFVISCIRKEQGCYRHSSCFLRKNLECRHQKYWYNPSYYTNLYPPPTRSCNYCLRFHVWIHSNPLFRILFSFRRSELLDTRLATSNISQIL